MEAASEDSDMINKAELHRFVGWTFERELTLLEELMEHFDRNSPTAVSKERTATRYSLAMTSSPAFSVLTCTGGPPCVAAA